MPVAFTLLAETVIWKQSSIKIKLIPGRENERRNREYQISSNTCRFYSYSLQSFASCICSALSKLESPLDLKYTVHYRLSEKYAEFVGSFQRSPVKNDCLQKMCEDMLGKNLALIMDSRVRWNSMLTNIAKMKDCVKSALKSLSDVDNFLYETELTLISDIMNALEPVAVCVNALGRKDCLLATAETEQRSDIAKKLFNAMKNRTEERRNASLCGLLCYLDNPSSYVSSSSSNCILTRPNKRDIKATAKDLFLFQEEIKDSDDSGSEKSDPDISKSIADQMTVTTDKNYRIPANT
ncbi:conserved hypothetical protein [Trichinella spiralis]|uniref:hypothetical protein n=1 Tax=Trichinella spiralis TaxID=6334 RepID=UPI0001EFC338|nr:conserved hypothetical protein [Trichinella spiralis]